MGDSSTAVSNREGQEDFSSGEVQGDEFSYEEAINEIDRGEGVGGTGDSFDGSPKHFTVADLRKLYREVQSTNPANEPELLDILKKALATLQNTVDSDDVKADLMAQEVSNALEVQKLEGGEGAEGEDGEEGASSAPTSVEKGVNHYEYDKSEALDFFPGGKGKEHVIDTLGPVTINSAPTDVVEANGENGYIVVKVTAEGKEAKTDIYRIKIHDDAKNFKVQINAETVTGNYEGDFLEIGPKGRKFISAEKRKSFASQLEAGASLIGGKNKIVTPTIPGTNTPLPGVPAISVRVLDGGKKYAAPRNDEEAAVKPLLTEMAAALRETDPENQKELWEEFKVKLDRLNTQTSKKGIVNDMFQLLMSAILGQCGEKETKDLLKLIPRDVTKLIEVGLMADAGEINNGDANRIIGNYFRWTHETTANFVRDNSVDNASTTSSSNLPDPNSSTLPPPPA